MEDVSFMNPLDVDPEEDDGVEVTTEGSVASI
jgi:hypothetical protein